MAFSRPAFEVPLHCESPDEFLQALSDTQRAVRTGELLDRESRQVIRKAVGGWHDIDDRNVREGLRLVNQLLRHLRTQKVTGQKDGRIRHVNGFLDFADMRFARELEHHREKCVEVLNEVLASVNLDPVG